MVDDVDTTVIVSGVADNGVEMLRCLDSGLSEGRDWWEAWAR